MKTSNQTIIAFLLKDKRERINLSQSEMAEKMGMSRGGWVKIENSTSMITIENLLLSCEILNITPQDIMKETEEVSNSLRKIGWEISIKKLEDDNLIQGKNFLSSIGRLTSSASIFGELNNIVVSGVALSNKFLKKESLDIADKIINYAEIYKSMITSNKS